MRLFAAAVALLSLASFASASPYRDDLVDYNINTNQNAQTPLDYSATKRPKYFPSPDNWREIPFYTILLDKFADGDPTNNDYFGTPYEWDWRETQLRFGGDLAGLAQKLDYLQGMGVKGIFISGTVFLNMIWQADSAYPPRQSSALLDSSRVVRARLLTAGLYGSGPALGHALGLAERHRHDSLARNVHHGGFHCRYHGRYGRLRRVSETRVGLVPR